jgi:hypothetical protein
MSVSTYPRHVNAHLDPGLNRWLWLLKWLLVIPHHLLLLFLWLAFVVPSVVAFFAILFTGRPGQGRGRVARTTEPAPDLLLGLTHTSTTRSSAPDRQVPQTSYPASSCARGD